MIAATPALRAEVERRALAAAIPATPTARPCTASSLGAIYETGLCTGPNGGGICFHKKPFFAQSSRQCWRHLSPRRRQWIAAFRRNAIRHASEAEDLSRTTTPSLIPQFVGATSRASKCPKDSSKHRRRASPRESRRPQLEAHRRALGAAPASNSRGDGTPQKRLDILGPPSLTAAYSMITGCDRQLR